MLIQILLAISLGILAGTITGLIPGIHINLVGSFIVAFSGILFYTISPIYLVVFIVSMAITHTFIDFIPSILLGCPDTDTELSTLPGHELLKEGQGYQAIILTLYGSLAAVILLIILALPFGFLISKIYEFITKIIPYLLILVSIMLINLEKKKLNAFIVFFLTGALGFCVLNLEILKEPLLPLLTGLFGSSMLIISIKNKTEIPNQKISKPQTRLFKPLLGSIISAPLCSFLPGLGAGQAAVIGNTITNKSSSDKKSFLVLLGATNTLVMGFSFITLYLFSKTRTGAASAINELINQPSKEILILILITILISGIISFFLARDISKFFVKKIQKINYTKISFFTIAFLCMLILFISGILGFLVFIISTITGIYCISLNVRRTNMMGCLLLPVIIYYLF